MALVEIVRFADVTEAQIAAGALRSAGFHVEVYDTDLGTMNFLMQQAIGGFRLMTFAEDRDEAAAMLRDLRASAPASKLKPVGSPARAAGALLAFFWLGGAGALLLAKRGRRRSDD